MTNLIVNPDVPYLKKGEIEAKANKLLQLYNEEVEKVLVPPIPVEKIAEILLNLTIDWVSISDTDEKPILALIDPQSKKIKLNERRKSHFEEYFGSEPFSFAHEIGHYELHLIKTEYRQGKLITSNSKQYLCRMNKSDPREIQANYFAGYLLMPEKFIFAARSSCDLTNWKHLYRLQDYFGVSISALTRRLSDMGLIYIKDKKIFRSKEEAFGQLTMLGGGF